MRPEILGPKFLPKSSPSTRHLFTHTELCILFPHTRSTLTPWPVPPGRVYRHWEEPPNLTSLIEVEEKDLPALGRVTPRERSGAWEGDGVFT